MLLFSTLGLSEGLSLVLDFGFSNYRRNIDVSNIATLLGENSMDSLKHWFVCTHWQVFWMFENWSISTPCKGITFLWLWLVDASAGTFFDYTMYGFKTININEARYKAVMRIRGGHGKVLLARLKKINWVSLSPCTNTLKNITPNVLSSWLG